MINDIFNATQTAKQFINDNLNGRLSHAYMIIGDNGAGKFTLVNAFSQLLLCESPGESTPCRKCSNCQYFEAFTAHPNVTVITSGDKASIGIAEIRTATENIYTAPYMASKKIYIIKNAEKMTPQAQNALLKILEEPPEYVVFFLLVSNRYSMLTTIISRCRVINMSPYPAPYLEQIAKEHCPDITSEKCALAVNASLGLPGRLLYVLSDEYEHKKAEIIDTILAMINGDTEKLFNTAQALDSRESALEFIRSLNEAFRDICVWILTNDKSKIISSDLLSLVSENSTAFLLKRTVSFIDEIKNTEKMLKSNAAYQLCIKNLLMKW